MKKKQILFVYDEMVIGGSTTSLLSILDRLNPEYYDVDLLLNYNRGPLLHCLPVYVHLLPPCYCFQNKLLEYFHRIINPRYMWHYFQSLRIVKKTGVAVHGYQYRDYKDIEYQRKIKKEYDVAISFIEGGRFKYVARHVKAKRKITWIHVNYLDVKFDPQFDRDCLSLFDAIILVSADCKLAFDQAFPDLSRKAHIVENILSNDVVKKRAKEREGIAVDQTKINLISVCRITFAHKGLDRAINALSRIRDEGMLSNFVWYIVGTGDDEEALKDMVIRNGLEKFVVLLGSSTNPYPFFNNMSLFFLPSRYEGKPMAVTEGLILGLPALVTEYSSAREQIQHDVDGYIMDNSEEGVYQGLKYILEHPEKINEWKANVLLQNYSNDEEMKKVEAVINGTI